MPRKKQNPETSVEKDAPKPEASIFEANKLEDLTLQLVASQKDDEVLAEYGRRLRAKEAELSAQIRALTEERNHWDELACAAIDLHDRTKAKSDNVDVMKEWLESRNRARAAKAARFNKLTEGMNPEEAKQLIREAVPGK